jgi:hypothetical protein
MFADLPFLHVVIRGTLLGQAKSPNLYLRPNLLSQQTSAVKAEPRIKPWVNTSQPLIIFSFPGFPAA